MEKISVVIPAYNRESTLLRAVKSALSQTVPVHEILICDDGSTDNSKKIITELNNPAVKWIDCGKNGMPSVPRNMGIKAATGEWIAFLDSDDEWLPEKINLQLEALAKNKTEACSTNANRMVNEKNCGIYLSFLKEKITFFALLPVNNIICSSVLVRKKLLERISFFPEGKEYKAIEDYALWLRLSTQTDFSFLPEPLVNYYDNPQSSVRSNYSDVWDLRSVIFSGFTNWLEEKKVVLNDAQKKQLAFAVKEIETKGKTSLWEKVKQKLK